MASVKDQNSTENTVPSEFSVKSGGLDEVPWSLDLPVHVHLGVNHQEVGGWGLKRLT